MGCFLFAFLIAGGLLVMVATLVWGTNDDTAWERQERRLRAEGIAPLRPDNWSTLQRRRKAAFIGVLIVVYLVAGISALLVAAR